MCVGHLEIVALGDRLRVAKPGADDVDRIPLRQFRLATRAQVVKDLGPGLDARPLDNPPELHARAGMPVAIAGIGRRAELSEKSNQRYLEALAAVKTPAPLKSLTDQLSRGVSWKGKRVRGLNLLGEADGALLAAAGRAEFLITGLRNRDLQGLLYAKATTDPAERRRRCGQITRQLRMLRAHGLIHKIAHTHRYMVSEKGRQVIAAMHAAREANIDTLTKAA